jgi:hypothetical protein
MCGGREVLLADSDAYLRLRLLPWRLQLHVLASCEMSQYLVKNRSVPSLQTWNVGVVAAAHAKLVQVQDSLRASLIDSKW